jgi:hypothetical protein
MLEETWLHVEYKKDTRLTTSLSLTKALTAGRMSSVIISDKRPNILAFQTGGFDFIHVVQIGYRLAGLYILSGAASARRNSGEKAMPSVRQAYRPAVSLSNQCHRAFP